MSAKSIPAANSICGGKTAPQGRMRLFRNMRGMTQKDLGIAVGFPERAASVRVAQYEAGVRCPKAPLTSSFAKALNVSPNALRVPVIEDAGVLMHTLFALEDMYGFRITMSGDGLCLLPDRGQNELYSMLGGWYQQAALLERGELTKSEYDQWRYAYTMPVGGDAT